MIRALFRGLKSLIRRLLKLGAVVGAVMFLIKVFSQQKPPPREDESAKPGAGGNGAGERVTERVSGSAGATATEAAPVETETAAPAAESTWVDPEPGGACPTSHPVKVKLSSGIYHVPGGIAYDRTTADRCYVDTDAAEADGYRPSKR